MICLQEYIDAHPETIVLDPLPAIRTLLDRSKSYELIRKIEAYMKGTGRERCLIHYHFLVFRDLAPTILPNMLFSCPELGLG